MPEQFTSQLALTPLTPEDFPDVLDLHMATFGTSRRCEEPIARSLVEQNVTDALRWGLRHDNQLSGIVELYDIEPVVAKLAYTIHPQWRGRGVATRAATAAVSEGFTTLGIDRVTANTRHNNVASQKVLAKVGFLAVEPQYGKWFDYVLTKQRYEARHQTVL